MLKRVLITFTAVAVLLGLTAVPTQANAPTTQGTTEQTAEAATALPPEYLACAPSGQRRVCVWFSKTFSGPPDYYWTIPTGTGGYCTNFGSFLNDKVRSWVITAGPRSATMYQHAGCSGLANSFIGNPAPDEDSCYSWWPGCSNGLDQGSSFWVLKS